MRISSTSLGLFVICSVIGALRLEADDWPRYGHDASLSARSSLHGRIATPQISWSYSVAGRELLVELVAAPGRQLVTLGAATSTATPSAGVRQAGSPQLDVLGDGRRQEVRETFHERWAQILPELGGYQRVAWNHTWTDQSVCRLQLFAYDQGMHQPRQVWETDPPEATIFNPLNIVCDIDRDGVQEICVAAHYRVMIFEGTTGRKESELRYHASRPYGWFGLADVDGDDQYELVTIGDFQSHVDVLDFDAGKPEPERLSVKWRRDIEQNIDERAKWPQVGPRPLMDVTGDGRPEVVFNLFNDGGDGQWHAVVLDASSGQTVVDLPRRYFQGGGDVDGSERASLFVSSTKGVMVHAMGRIELIQLQDATPIVKWSHDTAAWCMGELPCFGRLWSTTASQGMRQVLLRGSERPVFFAKVWGADGARSVTLSALHCDSDDTIKPLWRVEGLPESVELVALEESEPGNAVMALARVKLPANHEFRLDGENALMRVVQNNALGIDVSMPVVARIGPGQGSAVVVEGPGEQICAISAPGRSGEQPRLLWQRPGRGMRDGSRTLGLLAADLDGDGACEVLAADCAREGHAVLVAARGDGTLLWERAFDEIPGALPIWNVGALTFWWAGHFRNPQSLDVLVNTRRSLMHSDVGQLLDGQQGQILWQHDKAIVKDQFHWGWAGAPVAVCDLDADQLDEIISLHPVCFWIANGRDGAIELGRELASRKTLPAWAAYGEPMVFDFNNDGKLEVLLDSPYILALLELNGNPIWHGPPRMDYPVTASEGNAGETTQCKHALTDVDGDGHMEIASAGYGNGVRMIDPSTGQVLWSLTAPPPTCPRVASANVDSRAGDELLYVAGTDLVVVTGDRQSGRILWTWRGPATLSAPAIADVDDDGECEIVVQDARATIHCLDAAGGGNDEARMTKLE